MFSSIRLFISLAFLVLAVGCTQFFWWSAGFKPAVVLRCQIQTADYYYGDRQEKPECPS